MKLGLLSPVGGVLDVSSMSLRLHCEIRIVISSVCVLDVGVRVYVCVTVYTLGRHFFPTFLTITES